MSLLLATTEVVRVGKFGAVGVFNTALDFAIFNVLTSKAIHYSKLRANIISTSITMVISFILQRQVVFTSGGNALVQAVKFFAVTAFGLYILQNIIIHWLTKAWAWPKHWVKATLKLTGLSRAIETDFVLKNGAKAAGTLVSLTWNYLLYKRIVFSR